MDTGGCCRINERAAIISLSQTVGLWIEPPLMINDIPPARLGKTPPPDRLAPQDARDALADLLILHRAAIESTWLAVLRDSPGHPSAEASQEAIDFGFALCQTVLRHGDARATSRVIEHLGCSGTLRFGTAARLQLVINTMCSAMSPIVAAELSNSTELLQEAISLLLYAEDVSAALVSHSLGQFVVAHPHHSDAAPHGDGPNLVPFSGQDCLKLVCAEDVPAPEGRQVHLREPIDGARLRRAVALAAQEIGLGQSGMEDLSLAVGEAASNVLKHAGEGCAHVWCKGHTVYVRITDQGGGIAADDLPKALLPGWSSEVSLGMGFTLMLEMADALWLATGSTGTTICIEKTRRGGPAGPASPDVSAKAGPLPA